MVQRTKVSCQMSDSSLLCGVTIDDRIGILLTTIWRISPFLRVFSSCEITLSWYRYSIWILKDVNAGTWKAILHDAVNDLLVLAQTCQDIDFRRREAQVNVSVPGPDLTYLLSEVNKWHGV